MKDVWKYKVIVDQILYEQRKLSIYTGAYRKNTGTVKISKPDYTNTLKSIEWI